MKQIKILHLYYDLMNLSGETGNMVAIEDALKFQEVPYQIERLSLEDKIDFNKYDFIYVGSGSRDSEELARKNILNYKLKLQKIFKNKLILATGNAMELFGKSIDNKECLDLLPFKSMYLKEYVVEEKITESNINDKPVIAFINRNSENNIKDNHFLKDDGIIYNNFYGTYALGPLLIRNPYILNFFIKKIVEEAGYKYKEISETPDILAYNEYLKNNTNKKEIK